MESKDIAQVFNEYFQTVFSSGSEHNLLNTHETSDNVRVISAGAVLILLRKLDEKSRSRWSSQCFLKTLRSVYCAIPDKAFSSFSR